MYILDLETDGLLDSLTQIFCAVACHVETGEFTEFTPANIKDLPQFLDGVDKLSCHNGVGFDLKVLKKVLNYEYKGVYVDTLLVSRILWPDMELAQYIDESNDKLKSVKSPHSVESWGVRFGIAKPTIEDYSVYTENTLHRCKEDVKIQVQLYKYIQQTIKEYPLSSNWKNVVEMEQKVWRMLDESATRGWAFDLQLAYSLIDELNSKLKSIEDVLIPSLPKRVIQVSKVPCKAFKADGGLTVHAKTWVNDRAKDLVGDFSKVRFEDFNIGSSDQVKTYLLANGWAPKEWNFKKDEHGKPLRDKHRNLIKTSPKVPKTAEDWEEVAVALDNKNIALLAERNKAAHRRSQIQGLIDNTRSDHRIEAHANTCSTNTARMTHRVVVNIPKADPKVYYGKQMRSLFVASPGKVLVGCDASALEARCEAHYVYPYDNGAALELIEGDIHSLNANIFQVDRNTAKSGKYAILYGCSPTKLAATLNKPIALATDIYNSYWEGNPALKQLKEDLEEMYMEHNYIIAIDGRPLTIRYRHAILNTLLQSCGAIAVKIALCIQDRELKKRKLDAPLLGVFHDEMQRECDPVIADEVGLLMVESLRAAGKYLKLYVPLDGEYKSGLNWGETH